MAVNFPKNDKSLVIATTAVSHWVYRICCPWRQWRIAGNISTAVVSHSASWGILDGAVTQHMVVGW